MNERYPATSDNRVNFADEAWFVIVLTFDCVFYRTA